MANRNVTANSMLPVLDMAQQYFDRKARKKVFNDFTGQLKNRFSNINNLVDLESASQQMITDIYADDYLDPQEQATLLQIGNSFAKLQGDIISKKQSDDYNKGMLEEYRASQKNQKFLDDGKIISEEELFSKMDQNLSPELLLKQYENRTKLAKISKTDIPVMNKDESFSGSIFQRDVNGNIINTATGIKKKGEKGYYTDVNNNNIFDVDEALSPEALDKMSNLQTANERQKAIEARSNARISKELFTTQERNYTAKQDILDENGNILYKAGDILTANKIIDRAGNFIYKDITGKIIPNEQMKNFMDTTANRLDKSAEVKNISSQYARQISGNKSNLLAILENPNFREAFGTSNSGALEEKLQKAASKLEPNTMNTIINNILLKRDASYDSDDEEYKTLTTYAKFLKDERVKTENYQKQLNKLLLEGSVENIDTELMDLFNNSTEPFDFQIDEDSDDIYQPKPNSNIGYIR